MSNSYSDFENKPTISQVRLRRILESMLFSYLNYCKSYCIKDDDFEEIKDFLTKKITDFGGRK